MSGPLNFAENPDDYKLYLDMCNSEAYQQLQRFYHRKTIFDITGIARQENPHSSFIAWLLDPYESHGMNEYPMRRFLETICFAYSKYGREYLNETNPTYKKYLNNAESTAESAEKKLLFFCESEEKSELRKKIMQGNFRIVSCEITREWSLSKETRSRKGQQRIDIFINMELAVRLQDEDEKFNVLVAIENKVKSGENNLQTDKYMNYILTNNATKGFNFCIPIFLYPATNRKMNDDASSKNPFPCQNHLYLLLNYQYLLDGVLVPCQTAYRESPVFNMLEDYIVCLGKYIKDTADQPEQTKGTSGNNDSENMVMAVGRKEKEWIMQLWEHYSDVLLMACNEITEATEEFLIRKGNASDEQFYRSILSYVKTQLEDQKEDNEQGGEQGYIDQISEALKKKTTVKRVNYYVTQSDGKIWEFTSGSRGNRTLGALGYVIIRQYVEEHSSLSSSGLEEILKPIKHAWLRGGVAGKEKLRELSNRWLEHHTMGVETVCPRYFADTITDGQWTGCPLSESGTNPVKKKDPSVLQEHSCPLCPELSNESLFHQFYIKEQGMTCTCFYDFLDGFFVGGLIEELQRRGIDSKAASLALDEIKRYRKRGINETFGAVQMGEAEDYLYVARYWGESTLDKLIDILQMSEYVSKDFDKAPRPLNFIVKDITISK